MFDRRATNLFFTSCVTWSEDNVIAFTGPDGIYTGLDQNTNSESNENVPSSNPQNPLKKVKTEENQQPLLDPKRPQVPNWGSRKPTPENSGPSKNLTNNQPLPSPGVLHSPNQDLRLSASTPNSEASSQDVNMPDQDENVKLPRSKTWKRRQVRTSCLTHTIFVTNPIFPSEHTTLITSHEARIKYKKTKTFKKSIKI